MTRAGALRSWKRYASTIRDRLTSAADSRTIARWLEHAFDDFAMGDEKRKELLAAVAGQTHRLVKLSNHFDGENDSKLRFAELLLNACAWMDSGDVSHKEAKFRSYVDVTLQVHALRTFIAFFAERDERFRDPSQLTALLLAHFPDSRPTLLVNAEVLLDQRRIDEAMQSIRRALRIQAVCPTSQALLARANAARRATGVGADEIDGMNYDLTDKFCHMPFTHLSTGYRGDAFVCCCPAWVPFPVGNVLTAESADNVWNSDVAVEIRRSVHDGDFSYCSRTLCSYIAARKLPRKDDITDPTFRRIIDERQLVLDDVPRMVELNHDPTCNLACPSCRTEIITAKAEEQDLYAQAAERVILPLLKRVNGRSYISGGGEAFSSKHFRSILGTLNRAEYPGLYLYLITNGLAITPQRWDEFPNLPEMIDILSVSIDAAQPDTFERLRRPGKWPILMKNLEFMAGMRRAGTIRCLQINFVVQEENYREILDFVDLGERLGVDDIWFQRLTNYGAYAEDTFAQADVTSPQHPRHAELLDILRNPILARPGINVEMLMPLLPEVVVSDIRLPALWTSTLRSLDEAVR